MSSPCERLMTPRSVSRVFAMARPRRPASECDAVIAAARPEGTAAARARALARAIVEAAIEDIDRTPEDRLMLLLAPEPVSLVQLLATDADMGVTALVVRERLKRMEARSGQRLREWEWRTEDREIISTITAILAKRYARYLRLQKSFQ